MISALIDLLLEIPVLINLLLEIPSLINLLRVILALIDLLYSTPTVLLLYLCVLSRYFTFRHLNFDF